MGLKKNKRVSVKIEDKIVKANGVGIAISMLAKCYAAGELVWKKDLKKKQKKDRSKIKPEVRGIVKILFLDTYMGMPKPTLNGAIEKMINRTDNGHYIFEDIASKIPSVRADWNNQKRFLEKQVTYIWGTKPKLDKWIKENINSGFDQHSNEESFGELMHFLKER